MFLYIGASSSIGSSAALLKKDNTMNKGEVTDELFKLINNKYNI